MVRVAFECREGRAYDVAMGEHVTINFNGPIPLFPLPGPVLLPHSVLPLHVFEPRYRQMTTDVLDGPGLIAMGLIDGEVAEDEYLHGRPPLRPIVCVGYVERYESLEDGRYLVLLRGLCRAKIVEQTHAESYRTAMLTPVEWPPASDEDLAEWRDRLVEALGEPVFERLEAFGELRRLAEQPVPTAGLIDLAIAVSTEDTADRYAMLAENDAEARATWLMARLRTLRSRMSAPGRTNS